MSTPTGHEPVHEKKSGVQRRSRSETMRTGGLVALGIVAAIFAVLNLGDVEVDYVLGSGHAPLIIIIVISLLVGIVLGYLGERINRRRR
jgi:uncharacterized integral membrane protein